MSSLGHLLIHPRQLSTFYQLYQDQVWVLGEVLGSECLFLDISLLNDRFPDLHLDQVIHRQQLGLVLVSMFDGLKSEYSPLTSRIHYKS